MFHSLLLFSESASRAEGTFKYPIRRHTPSFWIALAFLVVKGIPQNMPPLETIVNTPENAVDTLCGQLHDSLRISSPPPQTAPAPRPSHSASKSHASLSRFLSRVLSARPSTASPSAGPETLTSQLGLAPVVYGHVRNLRGIISSHHYPMSTTNEQNMGRQLGTLASHYLASHGYGAEDINAIVGEYRCVGANEQLVTFLARRGMAVNEARFLLVLIDLRDT